MHPTGASSILERQSAAASEREISESRRFFFALCVLDFAILAGGMATMSDEGDRTCPLCAEEMDFTDQQLKPCKCGYEICVWCWHHIIEMAEKEGIEGRCPACRSTYDKERIVGMASNCEKVIAEINAERKQKSQKAKPKASAEARKHLGSVRVIQRNLVYIIGLPSALADESMLENREYFGQYGKVMKVSISRPAGGTPQASNSNTCSLYITYVKEEEAVRCIQAVHNFILDGKPLRACFGTTKYCHAWLKNMPCSNPDCFYLHDIGNQEDSFSKDEVISAYTRSRVPHIISSNLQRRSGSTLPPPIDDFCSPTSTKIIAKSPTNSSAMPSKSSPPNGFGAKSNVLPAAASWGSRVSHLVSTTPCLQGPSKQVQGVAYHASNLSSTVSSTSQTSLSCPDDLKHRKLPENDHIGHMDVRSRHVESSKACIDRHSKTALSNLPDDYVSARESSAWNDGVTMESKLPKGACLANSNGGLACIEPPKSYSGNSQEPSSNSSAEVEHVASAWDDDDMITVPTLSKIDEVTINSRYEPVDSLKSAIGNNFETSITDPNTVGSSPSTSETVANNSPSPAASEDADEDDIHHENSCSGQGYCTQSSSNADAHFQRITVNGNIQSSSTDLSSVKIDADSAACKGMGELQSSSPNDILAGHPPSGSLYAENHFEHFASLSQKQPSIVHADSRISREPSVWSSDLWKLVSPTDGNARIGNFEASNDQEHRYSGVIGQASVPCSAQSSCNVNALRGRQNSNCDTIDPLEENKAMHSSNAASLPSIDYDIRCSNEFQNSNHEGMPTIQSACTYQKSLDKQESNIARVTESSNINKNSIVDMREDMIISDILSMKFDPWDDSLTTDNSLIEILLESNSQNASWKIPGSWKGVKGQNQCQSRFSFAHTKHEPRLLSPLLRETETSEGIARDPSSVFQNSHTTRNLEPDAQWNHAQQVPSSAVSTAKISAPPGFSTPNRAPPPGFSSLDRLHQTYDNTPEGLHAFSSVKNQYRMPISDNTGDVEHIDPAILAAFHKGNFPSRLDTGLCARSLPSDVSACENDPRFQLLMQQRMAPHRTQIISGQAGDSFFPMTDSFYPKQFAGKNHSMLSNFAQMSSHISQNLYASSNQWNGWNDLQNGNVLDMMEILRNERRGLTKYFPGNEEHKFHVPCSGDLYNRSFGI